VDELSASREGGVLVFVEGGYEPPEHPA
jgi:hypothetical protein